MNMILKPKEGTSPGLDGITIEFFTVKWDVTGSSNPRVTAQSPHQLFPIGLCKIIYKCVAKSIAHSLRSILPKLVTDF